MRSWNCRICARRQAIDSVRAMGRISFQVIDFGPQGRITRTDFADLDGDGKVEILRFSGHRVGIYALTEAGVDDTNAGGDLDLSPANAELAVVGVAAEQIQRPIGSHPAFAIGQSGRLVLSRQFLDLAVELPPAQRLYFQRAN